MSTTPTAGSPTAGSQTARSKTPAPDCRLVPAAGGTLRCGTCGASFAAAAVDVIDQRRIEGGSDPEYQALQVRVRPPCPRGSGRVQALRLGYGPTASARDARIVEALPEP